MPDSRTVTRQISSSVWPRLREVGFEPKGRSAWRRSAQKVDVVTFWPIGSYNAGVYQTPPFSFKVQLGIWLPYAVPSLVKSQVDADNPRPDEAACPLRRSLRPPKQLRHPEDGGLWHLREDGTDIESAVDLAATTVWSDGLPWFERFERPRNVLRTFEDEDEDMEGTWGFGGKGSPLREQLISDARQHVGIPSA